jgi:signal peptidase I
VIGAGKREQILKLVRRAYPDWAGFADSRFLADEIDYKRAAAAKAQKLLGRDELSRLLKGEEYDAILARIRDAVKGNNLLYTRFTHGSDTNILNAPGLDKVGFSAAFLDLIWGEGDGPARLARYLEYVRANALPNKWTFPTYFLQLVFPQTDVFVRPAAFQWFCKFVGRPEAFSSVPSAESYAAIVAAASDLRDALAEFGPTDMIGVQSFIWACFKAQLPASSAVLPERRDELADLLEEFREDYIGSEDAATNFARYQPSRDVGQRNFEAILGAVAAGKDVTEDVLLGLLPYDSAVLKSSPKAWAHVAPVFAVDVRRKFEGSGWVQKKAWPDVARAILSFVQTASKKPAEVGAACTAFSALPESKGFQTGTLSPILNALRPDDYIIINNKPRTVINYLTGRKLRQSMNDYPELNKLGQRIIKDAGDALALDEPSGALPSDVFDQFCHWLVAVKKHPLNPLQYWKISPGENGRLWDKWREDGYIAIGWDELGDLTNLTKQEYVERRDRALLDHADWKAAGMDKQVWRFASQIVEGDRIVANNGTSEVLGIGTVSGAYYYVDGEEYSHRLPVVWDDTQRRNADEPGWHMTLVKLNREKFEQIEATGGCPPEPPQYGLPAMAAETGLELERLERWVRAIERKGQAILYGPPGTGKTFLAEKLARHLVAGSDGFSMLVQFHPSYAYEDFMQGIRPETDAQGQLTYPMKDGRFIEFCEEAREREGCCVLIIDEINRAPLSRVFGELMYLLEYRAKGIPLAGGRRFSIPSNVRLIGTMNTADRSIALVDHALRRRFAFLELYPDYDVLRQFHRETGFDPSGLVAVLECLNRDIGDRHYEVGITYFMSRDIEAQIEDVWRMEIEPYLDEYFYDRPGALKDYGWESVRVRILGDADHPT